MNDHKRVVHGVYQRKAGTSDDSTDQSQQPNESLYDTNPIDAYYNAPVIPEAEPLVLKAEPRIDSEALITEQNEASKKEKDLRSLICFPEPEGSGSAFQAFKQPKLDDDEEMTFVDPLAMMDAVTNESPAEMPYDNEASASSPADTTGSEQCTICQKSFKSSSALRLHRFSAHGTCPKKECPKCNKSFLPWHFTRHCCWNKDDEQSGAAASNEAESGSATCELCRRSYTSARTLKEHMRTVHGVYQRRNQPQQAVQESPGETLDTANEDDTKQQQNYVCTDNDCGASFSSPLDLLLHRLAHTGDKPFVCDKNDCKEAFAAPQELDEHRRTVHESA